MSWLTNWNYRKAVTVSNAGSTLSDYQVLTTIDTATLISAGKMRSDCGDIRFTDSDESTLLSYWIESGCNSTLTKIWIKIPSIPTSKTIYLYYGNASAVSTSNGTNTFEFFDDFEDGIYINKWTKVGTSTVIESGGKIQISGTGTSSYLRTTPDWTFSDRRNIAVELDLSDVVTWDGIPLGIFNTGMVPSPESDSENAFTLMWNVYKYEPGFGAIRSGLGQATPPLNVKYTYNGTISKVYFNNVEKASRTWTPPTVEFFAFGNVYPSAINNNFKIDNLRVRKYASPEPTFGVSGLEESPGCIASVCNFTVT